MEEIEKQLNNLSTMEIPVGMHQSVMRKIQYQKIKPVLFVSFVLLTLNFLLLVWRIDAKLVRFEFVDMSQDFFEVFSFNFSFIGRMFGIFFEIISPVVVLFALLNLAGAIYIAKKIRLYNYNFA